MPIPLSSRVLNSVQEAVSIEAKCLNTHRISYLSICSHSTSLIDPLEPGWLLLPPWVGGTTI